MSRDPNERPVARFCQESDEIEGFGRDNGLLHELVVTGRKVGADRQLYADLAHNQDLFLKVTRYVRQLQSITFNTCREWRSEIISCIMERLCITIHDPEDILSFCGALDKSDPSFKDVTRQITTIEFQRFPVGVRLYSIAEEIKDSGYYPATWRQLIRCFENNKQLFYGLRYAMDRSSFSDLSEVFFYALGSILTTCPLRTTPIISIYGTNDPTCHFRSPNEKSQRGWFAVTKESPYLTDSPTPDTP